MNHSLKVCLVAMPYAPLERPSLGLSLLSAALQKAGFRAEVAYESLHFAHKISLPAYLTVSKNLINQLGEWSFATSAFEGFAPDAGAYLRLLQSPACASFLSHYVAGERNEELTLEFLLRLQAAAREFVAEAAARILSRGPTIVGCTSLFQQHTASLALLKRIKETNSAVVTILGGTACDGPLGVTTKTMAPWVDYVFSGESEDTLPRFCALLSHDGCDIPSAALPEGIIDGKNTTPRPKSGPATASAIPIVSNLDTIPYPDFSDYHAAFEVFPANRSLVPMLLFETSRGCWWYERSGGCTFCILTPHRACFRTKSPDRVVAEIEYLRRTYRSRLFMATDDILDTGFYTTLLPRLSSLDCLFFFEIKANVNEAMIESLARAGAKVIQVGIESLNDEALRMMNKGSSALTNIYLLKLALEKGVRIVWHLLHGLPGEKDDWHEETARLLPLLAHLQPADGLVRLHFDRFSRYVNNPEQFGLALTPHRVYTFVYPFPPDVLAHIAYFFENEKNIAAGYQVSGALIELQRRLEEWQALFAVDAPHDQTSPPRLVFQEDKKTTVITDTRPCARRRRFRLSGLTHLVHRACRQPAPLTTLLRRVRSASGESIRSAAVEKTLRQLGEDGIVICRKGLYLSLATKEPEHPIPSLSDVTDFLSRS